MNELYLIKSGDNGFVEETSAVISADSGEISINDSLYVESAGNIGIGSSNPVNKLDVVGSASISNNLTVEGITFSNVGGNSPSSVNDIIKYDGNNWVVAASTTLPGGGGGGAGNSAVPAGLINTLTQGAAIHEVTFGYDSNNDRIVYDNVPKIAASLEIDGAGEIIPHTVSGVSESGYFVVFSEELPTANYRMHTVFGGTDAFWETGVANLEYSDRNVEIDRSLYVGQKVGIGTTNPGSELEVNGTIKFGDGHTIGDGPGQNLHVTSSAGENILYTAAGGIHAFLGGSDERLRIDAAGNVGIGTTNPGATLHVKASDDSTNALAFWVVNKAHNNSIISAYENGDVSLGTLTYKDASGNVGIGTTSPSTKMLIKTSAGAYSSTQGIAEGLTVDDSQQCSLNFYHSGTGSALSRIVGVKGASGNSDLAFITQNTVLGALSGRQEWMRIKNTGSVGIGTTSPNGTLELNSSSTDTNFYMGGTPSAGSREPWRIQAEGDILSIGQAKSSYAKYMTFYGSNVGIGITNPSSKLTVNPGSATNAGTWSDSALAITNQTNIGSYSQISFGYTVETTNAAAYLGFVSTNQGSNGYGDLVFGTRSVNTDTAPTERMRINSNGNVGIGATNPTSKLQIEEPVSANQTTALFVRNQSSHTSLGGATIAGFHNASDYVMQIKTNGNVGIGTTNPSAGRLDVWQTESASDSCIKTVRPGSAERTHLAFYTANGLVGTIKTSGNTTSYNTSSDYRLKENVIEVDNAIERVNNLKPCRFNFIADPGKIVDGFLAHEVQEVVPEAISGEKDAVKEEEYEITPAELDDDGNVITEAEMGTRQVPDYQGIDQGKLVPLLTKAIQEQQAMIEDLKKEIEQLKS